MSGLGRPRHHARVTGSTNSDARALAVAGAPHGTLVTAGAQTSGRGRQGRGWAAAPGRALLMSLVLREFDALLALRAGLAGAEAAGPAARVKWPNDVLVDGRKVAGILGELAPDRGWAVLGAGVNVALDETDLPATERVPAGTLGRSAADVEPFLSVFLTRLEDALAAPAGEVLERLRARDALLGRPVRWRGGAGMGAGIDADGLLRVATADGVRRLGAGEVHLL